MDNIIKGRIVPLTAIIVWLLCGCLQVCVFSWWLFCWLVISDVKGWVSRETSVWYFPWNKLICVSYLSRSRFRIKLHFLHITWHAAMHDKNIVCGLLTDSKETQMFWLTVVYYCLFNTVFFVPAVNHQFNMQSHGAFGLLIVIATIMLSGIYTLQ